MGVSVDHGRLLRDRVFSVTGYPFAAERVPVDHEIVPHSHDFLEIAVVLEGTADHVREAGTVALTRGSVVAIRPGQWHGYRRCDALEVVNIYLGSELLSSDLAWVLDHPGLARLLLNGGEAARPVDEDHLQPLTRWLAELAGTKAERGNPSAGLAVGLGSCALAEIATSTTTVTDSAPPISPVVRRAMRMLGDELAHPWQMAELADRLGVSVPHLHRLFATEVRVSPIRWLVRNRVERAAALLITTDDPVSGIGARVGWPDPSYFARRFRTGTGMSPTRYRDGFRG